MNDHFQAPAALLLGKMAGYNEAAWMFGEKNSCLSLESKHDSLFSSGSLRLNCPGWYFFSTWWIIFFLAQIKRKLRSSPNPLRNCVTFLFLYYTTHLLTDRAPIR